MHTQLLQLLIAKERQERGRVWVGKKEELGPRIVTLLPHLTLIHVQWELIDKTRL